MPDQSPILSLPLILPAQAQKHVTHNEALRLLDVMVQLTVLNRTLTAAPLLPAVGDRHIVAAGAVGDWAGQTGRIALYTVTGWQFFAPLAGWRAYVLAEAVTVVYSGLVWAAPAAQSTAPIFGVNTTADTTNRLSVQSAATLLSHNGAGHQVKVNKAAVGDTASLLFQTGFSGRAEMGLSGNDGFSIKVSPDGTVFNDALSADPATGSVSLAKPAILTGQISDPASPANGTIWHNTTSGEVKLRAGGVTLVVGAGGGGISDGDKGDITVSGGGAAWAIDAGAVTLAKMASIATDSFLGRDTAGSGAPEVMTPAQSRVILNVADGATANAGDAALRDRATHTGTQTATTISDFIEAAQDAVGGMVDASLTYADGTPLLGRAALTGDVTALAGGNATTIANDAVSNAKLANMAANTIKGNASGVAADPADLTATQARALLNVADGANNYVHPNHSGDVTSAADGAMTIANNAVTNAKAADMATATLKGRLTAATGDPEDLTGMQATTLLDPFTSALKGLTPASGGGTANFLRADGTWAAPGGGGGGGAPGGATGQVQFNAAGAFGGAGNVEISGGHLKLLAATDPAAPTGGLLLYARSLAGRVLPKIIGPSGIDTSLQTGLHGNSIFQMSPANGSTSPTIIGGLITAVATVTHQQTIASANLWQATRRTRFQTTTTAGNASGVRTPYGQWFLGNAAGFGGFFFRAQFGMNINLAGGQKFCGMAFASTAIAGDPSGLLHMCGMGYDAADSAAGNWQFMRNDGTGLATRVDLGTGAARNVTHGYDLIMFAKPNNAELFVRIVNLHTGVVLLDTSYTTDLPAVNTALSFKCEVRNGAVAAADNIEIAKAYIESDY